MGLEPNSFGHCPEVAHTAYVHPTAVLIGHVIVAEGVLIGPQAVVRADEPGPKGTIEPIVIGRQANIQDGAIIHALGGTGVAIGPRTSIAHGAVVHGPCKIGMNCFVGFNSVVFRSTLDDGVIVMHQSLVEGVVVSGGLLVPSSTSVRDHEDVVCLSQALPEVIAFVRKVADTNALLAKDALLREKNGQTHGPKPHLIAHS